MSENVVDVDGAKLHLPVPRNAGAAALFGQEKAQQERFRRLVDLIPNSVQRAAFLTTVAQQLNTLPVDVDPKSTVVAVFNAASIGVLPGKPLNHVFFVPFGKQVQLVFGYEGLLFLAYQAAFLAWASPEVVLRGEEYRHWNEESGARLNHSLPIERDETWDNVLGAYLSWQSTAPKSKPVVTAVPRSELEGLRKAALAKARGRSCPWQTHPIAMCKKTPVHRASKLWPKTGLVGWQLGRAVELDEQVERGEPQEISVETAETIEEAEGETGVSVNEYGGKPLAGDASQAAEPYVVRLRMAKNPQEAWNDISADPEFEKLPQVAQDIVLTERNRLIKQSE